MSGSKSKDPKASVDDDDDDDEEEEEEGLIEEDSKGKKRKTSSVEGKNKKNNKETKTKSKKHKDGSGKNTKKKKTKKKQPKGGSNDDDDDDDDDDDEKSNKKGNRGFIDDAAVLSGSDDDSEDEDDDDNNDEYEKDGFIVDEDEDDDEDDDDAPKKRSRDETGEGLEDSDDDDDESIDSNDSDEEAQERRRKKNKIRVTKKLKRLREMDVLDEDDLDLINEARGLPTDRELKLRRELEEERLARERRVRGRDGVELSKGLFTGDSSDDDGDDGGGGKSGKTGKGGGSGKGGEGGKRTILGSSKDGKKTQQRRPERYDEDGLDDFIEDDIGDQDDIRQGSGALSSSMYGDDEVAMEGGVSEAQLNEAEEIFGTDYLDFMDGGADGKDGDPLGGDGGYGDEYDDDFEERKRRKKFRERGVGVNLGVDSDEEIQEEDSDYDDDDDDDDDLFGEDDNLAGMDDKQRAEVLRLKREKKKLAREEKRRERRQKIEAKRKAMLRRAFEPVQLVENFCTEKDDAIRMADSPERFYDWLEGENNPNVRPVPEAGEPIQIEEEEEAMWIMGKIPEIASECYSATVEALAAPKENGESDDMSTEDLAERKERAIRESIAHALRYMRRDKLEPEFIKRYRADIVSSPAVRNNLYRIMDEDAEWERMVEARSKIETILNELNDEIKAEQDGKAGEEHLLKLKEQLTIAQQKLENTVKDEERVKVELQGLEKSKALSADGDKDKDDDDDDLFGDDDDEEDEATKAAKEKQKASLQSHLDTITTLLQTQSEQVARLDTAYHEAEAAAAATSQGERSNLIAALSKKFCRDKLWHYRDYNEYVSSILEYRHVMDIKGYLNLIKEGNEAIREKASTLGGVSSSKSGKDKKKRSKRFDWDLYRTCVSEGLRNICYRFLLSPFRVGIKLEETHNKNGFSYERILPGDENNHDAGEPRQWMTPKIEDANPQEFASELVGSGELVLLSTARDDADWQDNPEMNDPLKGCRYVAAMELAHEPRIRRVLRAIYRSEAVITTRPTSKGLGIIDGFHEYYGLHLLRNKPVKEHFPMDAVELEKRRARLNAEEVKELDAELKLKETNSCIQYLNILKAERSGDITIHVHLPFTSDVFDNDKPWYKCELENFGRDRQDLGRFMEALERVYFPADNDTDEWNDERRKILKMALVNYLLPQFEAETRRDLKDVSTRVGIEAAAQTLRYMAMEGPYRPSHLLGENRFIVPTGDLPIVGVCSSNDPKEGTFLAAVNGRGELSDHFAIPGGTSITSEKMREKVVTFLMQNRPAAVVVGSGAGVGCKLTARRLGEVITQATERWNNRLIQGQDEDDEDFEARMQTFRLMHSNIDDDDDEVWKCNVDIVDDNVAQLFGRSVRGKKEFPDMAVNLKVAVATARWAKDPLGELAYTWSTASDAGVFGTEMLFLNIHPLQRLLPKQMLLREYERVLCDVTASVGVDLNGACTYDHLHGLLTFVPGLGPRKANNLKQSVSRIGGVVSSRKSLLVKRLMGPIVYNNSVAFLRIRATDQLQDQLLHPLDDSRCHPDVYHRNKWAIKIAVDALELGDSASNDSEDYAITALRDVMQNSRDEIERLYNATKAEWEAHYGPTFNVGAWDPREAVPAESWRDKVEELDLETFADMIEENGNGKWLTHLTMVKWEFRLPFEDPRKPMEPPSGEKLFRLLTGESDVTLCPGKEVTGKVVKNGDFGSQVKLEGDVPGFIPLRNLADDHVEAAEDIVSVGTIVTAIITEVKMDHMCVDLSLKMEDFKKKSSEWGRPRSLPPLDEFFDREAAFKIDEEKEKERESRLRALRLTIGGSGGTKIGGDANDIDGGDGTQAARTGKVTRRACAHPAFRNASHSEVDRELKEASDAMVGEALIRPSNRSCDSLAIHWMVRPGCIKVIEVHEEDKDTDASIGNRLIIKKEVYGSIDELLGRYIAPMNDRVEEIQHHRKFVDKLEDELDTQLYEMKKANANGVFYFICWSESYPGYISLRFIMSRTARNHTIGISPEGFVWNGKTYNNLDKLLNDFKKNPSGARTTQHRPNSNGSAMSMSTSMSTSRQSTGMRTEDTSRQSRSRWGPAAMPPVPVAASRWGNMPPPPAGPPPSFARPDGAPPNFGYRPPPPPGAPPGYRQ